MRTPNHVVLAATTCFLLVASACTSQSFTRSTGRYSPTIAPTASRSHSETLSAPSSSGLERSVIRVEVPEPSTDGGPRCFRAGTGVYIGGHTVITAHHVIADGPAPANFSVAGIRLLPWNAPRSAANNFADKGGTFAGSPYMDVAVIHTTKPAEVEPARLATRRPNIGDSVTTYGLGGGLNSKLRHSTGAVVGRSIDGTFLALDIPSIKGDSGGPVFNADGDLIGIILGGGPDFAPWKVRVYPERDQQFSIIYPDFDRASPIQGKTLVLDLTSTKLPG
ncbi:MAG: trypsin-like peptidase domain-containing protein [Phycisphaerales bacterium]|nr:trypsin-like peptidase domain-containing protein [Phycisphaerales bacterium]